MNTADRRIADVERYIHELAIALSGLPADEREDVIASIREHIDDSLLAIADPTPADVQRVLDELGDPLAIAADAGAPAAPPSAGRPDESRPVSDVQLLEREWVPMAVIGSFALAGLFFWLGGPVAALGLWLLGLVGLLASPLWHAVEKIVGSAALVAGPAVVLGLWVGYVARWGWFGNVVDPRPPRLIYLATTGIVIAGLVVVSVWLLSRGSLRVRDRASTRAAGRRR